MSGRVKKKNNEKSNSKLRQTMLNRLKSARLRFLNDAMYNNNKGRKILINKETFKAYHESFEEQQQLWTTNPLDIVINDIKEMYKSSKEKSNFTVADFGCGSARIAKELEETKVKVHSFDLVALNDRVTVCDMTHTPLSSSSVDVVVNCLSLMSSDCTAYIDEGRRVLKNDGVMLIVEVSSRLNTKNNFVEAMKDHGLSLVKRTFLSDEYFCYFKFIKKGKKKTKAVNIILETCKYKKRFSVAEIEPSCLYLSGASVLGGKTLTEMGITCLISACPELPEMPLPPTVHRCHRLDVRDVPTADIGTHLSDIADIITKVKEEGGRTLVHCVAGVSRSATLCIGYLIKSKRMSLEQAYHHVHSCRPCIKPNNGFFQQLIQFEKEITGSTTVEMVYNEAAKTIIPNVYESDYENTIRYISRSVGIK